MASYPIIINKSHWISDSTYVYPMGGSIDMSNVEIALEKASVWFSWENITIDKNNNKFSIIHPTTAGSTTISFTIPNGGYNISDLNTYLRWYLINQGYYIQNNSTLEQIVYCKFDINPSTYKVQFISYPMPTGLPTGYSAGPTITFPLTTQGPQLIVPTNNFGTIIGFAPGTFPVAIPTTISTTGSTLVPVVSDIQNVVITLDSCYNKFNPRNSSVIYAFSPAGFNYAELITSEPNNLSFVPQQQGLKTELLIQLRDQYLRPLNIIDKDITIVLQLREKTISNTL